MFSFAAPAQIIRTIAGRGPCSGIANEGDGGQAAAAQLGNPYGIAVDTGGNIYFSDFHFHTVKKIKPSGIMTTYAGNGFPICTGDGGQATAASISGPQALVLDAAGNLYIGDAGNKEVRKVNAATGIITTVAGHCGSTSIGGDGGQATNAGLGSVSGLAFDAAGNLYIADGNTRVRKVSAATGIITTIIGSGGVGYSGNGGQATLATFDGICDIAIDASGNMYVTDKNNSVIRKVNTAGIVSLFAGTQGAFSFLGDGGPATAAKLSYPSYLKFDAAGNLCFSDQSNHRIRKITPAGIISTIAGFPPAPSPGGFAGDGGPATAAKMYYPTQLCFDAHGNLFIAEQGATCSPSSNSWGHRIRGVISKVDTFPLTVTPGRVLCGNTAATFTAHPYHNGYYTFIYKWRVNGLPVGTNSPVYASTTVNNNDTVTCAIVDTTAGNLVLALSDTIIMTVLPPMLPVVHVTNTGDTICAGLPITFTATATNGGSAPLFQWYVNGTLQASGTAVFTYIPLTGDVVTCKLTSNDPCTFPNTSHVDIPLSIIPSFHPTILLHANPDSVITYWGEVVTLFADVTYEGYSPTYQWCNSSGPIAGATNATYQQTINAPDTIYCVLHSSFYCAVPDVDTSNRIHIGTGKLAVGDLDAQTADFTIYPNPNNGSFMLGGTVHGVVSGDINIDIRNVVGQTIYHTSIHPAGNSIELPVKLSNMPPGMYYLITGDEKGSRAMQFMVR